MLARIALAEGDTAGARSDLEAALATYRELGLRWEEAITASLLASVVSAVDARALRDAARVVFASLGDGLSLASLEAAATSA